MYLSLRFRGLQRRRCCSRRSREAGLPSLDLSVVDGGPARRMYDAAGFRVLERVLTAQLPA